MPLWLRDNLFVAAALGLPLLVVVIFLTATTVPHWIVPGPQYDLWLAVETHDVEGGEVALRYRVSDNGKLFAEARLIPPGHHSYRQRLLRFDALTRSAVEVEPVVPDDVRTGLWQQPLPQSVPPRPALPPSPAPEYPMQAFAVREAETLTLLTSMQAPDGYQFEHDNRHGGIVTELFGGRNRWPRQTIAKNGRVFEIEIDGYPGRYGADATLLGWSARD